MLVGCPKCKTKYRIGEMKAGGEGVVLRCSKCRGLFRMIGRTGSPPAGKEADVRSDSRIRVLVANESPVFCRAVEKVLSAEPFDVFTCNDGKSALDAIEEMIPHVVLLDVALPVMYGFEVCEAVRKNPATASVKIILIAAIYDGTRYKREPCSLYGADDYIEKHHIPDALAAKIYKLVFGGECPEKDQGAEPQGEEAGRSATRELTARELAELESTRHAIKQDEERETGTTASPDDTVAHEKARRLARLIVSDIALYNQDRVEDGVRNGSFYTLLEEDVREGRALYERRISEEIRTCTSYLEEAFEELVSQKKQEMKLLMK
ncbi:MAG TPA: response regulator [Geobacteraceae bacterium]|nr:response regulator [Geobacteraceae bacterium]